jgi:hypothetical protein
VTDEKVQILCIEEARVKDGQQARRSDLFLVRVWDEDPDSDAELRGRVQRAVSGETHYFRNLPELAALLHSMMPGRRGVMDTPQERPGTGTEADQANTPVASRDETGTNPANSE